MHSHAAARAVDQAHNLGTLAVKRHEIDQDGCPVCRFEARFKDQRIGPILARDVGFVARRHQPATMIAAAEQRRKARFRIEARPAQPVDRTIPRDERGAPAIAD